MTTTRAYAEDRDEGDMCQRGTTGCSIDHTAERYADSSTCETW